MEHNLYIHMDNDRFKLSLNEAGGFVFLHMEMKDWSTNTLKELKEGVESFMSELNNKGHDIVFATTDDEKTLKFWQMIKPCDQVTLFGDRDQYIMGSWFTEEK